MSLWSNLSINIKNHQTSVTTPPLYKEKCITGVITGFAIKVTIVLLQYNPDLEIVKFSIYTLSDLGDLSNLIRSLSRTIQQYSTILFNLGEQWLWEYLPLRFRGSVNIWPLFISISKNNC